MMDDFMLSETELHYLRLIEKGLYEHRVSRPAVVSDLISKGMVEELTTMVFPLIPPRTVYRLTALGKHMLAMMK